MTNPFNFEPEPLKGDTSCGCQHQEIDMDIVESDSEEEFRGGRRFPMRSAGLRSRPLRRPLGPAKRALRPPLARPKRPWLRPSRPPYRRPWVSWPIDGIPDVYREPHDAEPGPPTGSEHVRWVQDCLNQALGLQLPVTGLMGRETRSAVRSFQRQQGLRASGIVGPDTEEALKCACSGTAPQATDDTQATGEFGLEAEEEGLGDIFGRITSGIGTAYGRVKDVLGATTSSRIVDLTAQSDKSVRKGTRDPKTIYAIVLHQMACCARRKNPFRSYLKTKSHFAILRDGTILQLHRISDLIWASNGFNARSVAVEFAGNFPNIKGKWWVSTKYNAGRDRPTQAQFEAGRYLIRHLVRTMGLTHVLAHRQSSGTRENDPGPDIWSQVGQWAVNNLGLKDGGPGFKIGTGNPIPDAWRTWGGRSVVPEMSLELESELSETEIAHDVWQGEDYVRSPEYVRWVQRSLNAVSGLHLPVDGIAGPTTRSAVRSFQRQQGLSVSGVVGTDTETALREATGGEVAVAGIDSEFNRQITAALRAKNVTPPQFQNIGPLTRSTVTGLSGPGLYVIKHPHRRPYIGQTTNLKERLLQHLWCTEHLDVPTGSYQVFIAPRPNATRPALRAEERRMTAVLRPTALVTNQRTELEQELWGEAWN